MSSTKIRILYVITSLRFGGAEKLVTDLSLRLKSEGNEVEVFLLDGTETPLVKLLEDNGILIHKASRGYSQMWNPLHYRKLKKILWEKQYNIVHSHNTTAQFLTCLAGSKKITGTKYITTEHNTYNRRRSWPFFKWLDRKIYDFYDNVICVSDTTKLNLLKHLSLSDSDDKYVTIYNGVDLSKFRIEKIDKPLEYKNKVVILMVAAFRKQKDQPTLIRSLKHLPENYIVWLAGDGTLRKKCEKLAKNLGLENRVIFLGNRTDIPELYAMSDIIVMSSHYEGMSLSSIEALATGKPIVASDVEGLREMLDGVGILFREGDVKELSDKLIWGWENRIGYQNSSIVSLKNLYRFDISKTFFYYKEIYNCLSN